MTNQKYYVKDSKSFLDNQDYITLLTELITATIGGIITKLGAKAVIDFTIGATLSTSSQFTVDVAKLDIGIIPFPTPNNPINNPHKYS